MITTNCDSTPDFVLLPETGRPSEAPHYNFRTAHVKAMKITHNNVLTTHASFPTFVHNLIDTMTQSDVTMTSYF